MADVENKYYQAPLDGVVSEPIRRGHWFKMGIALIIGSCLALMSFVVSSISTPTVRSTSADDTSSLIGLSPVLRGNPASLNIPRAVGARVPAGGSCQDLSAMKNYVARQIIASKRGDQMRDISVKANELEEIAAVRQEEEALKAAMANQTQMKAADLAGVTGPLGFWDPLGFSTDCPTGKLLFYREVELKHGRLCMLASLGILVAEQFHPLFGGNIDAPAYVAFQQTPLQKFWLATLAAIAIPEIFSIGTFKSPFGMNILENLWSIKEDHEPGNLGFDPLGLRPTDKKEWMEIQNKELNNGRLAMIAAAGMIAQELATGKKLFG